MLSNDIQKAILSQKQSEKAKTLSRFFKTDKGEYGEGDLFLGLTVPVQRQIVKKFKSQINANNFEAVLQPLLTNKYHEFRLVALLLLVELCKKTQDLERYLKFYLKNTKYINNWDLVDLSAPKISGVYYFQNQSQVKDLYKLAKSKNLWKKRIAMLSMYEFIRQNDFEHPLAIAEILLHDHHDLIHKSVGWMLREIGKRSQKTEEKFLQRYYQEMPRTMLRYSIEKFEPRKKDFYMGRLNSIK